MAFHLRVPRYSLNRTRRGTREGGELVMDYFIWLEETGFSIWMRESGPAFFSSLVLHSLSMAMVVGVNVAIALRILGVAGRVPVSAMARFTPVAYWGLAVVLISGGLLLVAYPTKALTNPVFYFKLLAVIAALFIARGWEKRLLRDAVYDTIRLPKKARLVAMASLVLWAAAITSGRLLAYTYNVLMASHLP